MAGYNLLQKTPTSYDQAILQAQQQQKFAQSLRDSSLQDIPGQMVSGHYVGSGIVQQLARLLKAYMGGRQMEEASSNLDTARKDYNSENAKVMGEILKASETSPEAAQGVALQYPDNTSAQQYLAYALKNGEAGGKVLQYLTVDTPTGPEYAAGMMNGTPKLTGMKVAKPLKFVGQGDSTQGVNSYTGEAVGESRPINVSPDAQLSSDTKRQIQQEKDANGLMSDEAIEREARNRIAGNPPSISRFDKVNNARVATAKARIEQEEGYDPLSASTKIPELKQLDSSITAQEKRYGAMQSFVGNMDRQYEKLKAIAEKIAAEDPRFMNVPRRAWNKYVTGSADQSKFDTYLADLSREAAKIASGSEASIGAMPVEEVKKWDSLHDPNLSAKDIIDVMGATLGTSHARFDEVAGGLNRDRERRRQVQDRKDRGESTPVPRYSESIGKKSLPLTNDKGWKLKEIYYEGKLHRAYVGPNPSTDVEEVQ